MKARAHHYVPQCWLAGFTDSGSKDGTIFVTDLKRRKQFQTTPKNCGHMRDFYRIEGPDPLAIESFFSKVESATAPILNRMFAEYRSPDVDELQTMLEFIGLQWARVPAFRPFVLGLEKSVISTTLGKILQNSDLKADLLRAMSEVEPDVLLRTAESLVNELGSYTLNAENDWFILRGIESLKSIVPRLKERHWAALISHNGNLIGSDNPVVLEGPSNQPIGFRNAEIVGFYAHRRCIMMGTKSRVRTQALTYREIAHMNTLMLLNAQDQVFSHKPDFCWEDSSGKIQNRWEPFLDDEKLHERRDCRLLYPN